ncbi:hypothetical protein Tco_0250283, partial [Tanacetum coccineum]
NATDLDAPKGYIPLYLSLFSIGNLCFHLNNFCLDVFEIFRCHFPLLSPFGVARVTTFTVACKAYGREDTVPLFRSLLTLGPTGDWFTFQKRHDFSIPTIFGDSMSNILKWKSEFIFIKQTLISNMRSGLISDFRHGRGFFSYPYPTKPFDEEHTHGIPSILINGEDMAFQNFMKKPGQSPSFSMRLANRPVDVGSPSISHLTLVVNDDQVESSSYSRDKGVMGHELVVVGEGCSEQDVMAVGGSKKRCLITKALEEEATVMRPVSKNKKFEGSRRMSARGSVPLLPVTAPKGVGKHPRVLARFIGNLASGSDSLAPEVEEAHAAHNMISGLHYLLLKDKLGFLTFDELVDIYDIHAFQMAVKSLLEHEMSKLEGQLAKAQKNQDVEGGQVVKDLRSENALNLEELLMLQRVTASLKESRKKLEEEVDGLQSRLKETERLGQRCQDLEHERDFLLKKSKEVSVLASQLEAAKLEKSKLVKDFIPLADYHPKVEKIFYEDAEAFYKLEFPYISLLVENAGLSSEELDSLEAPLAQEAPLP